MSVGYTCPYSYRDKKGRRRCTMHGRNPDPLDCRDEGDPRLVIRNTAGRPGDKLPAGEAMNPR